jgi:hypothetical protein
VDDRVFIDVTLLVVGYGTDLLAYTNDPTIHSSYALQKRFMIGIAIGTGAIGCGLPIFIWNFPHKNYTQTSR